MELTINPNDLSSYVSNLTFMLCFEYMLLIVGALFFLWCLIEAFDKKDKVAAIMSAITAIALVITGLGVQKTQHQLATPIHYYSLEQAKKLKHNPPLPTHPITVIVENETVTIKELK